MISDAIDLMVQIGIRKEICRVIAISNVAKDLKNGDVYFEPIYRNKEDSSAEEPYWKKQEN